MPTSDEIIQQWLQKFDKGGKSPPVDSGDASLTGKTIPPTQKNFIPPPNTPDTFTAEQAPFLNPGQPQNNPFNKSVPSQPPPGFSEGATGNVDDLKKLLTEESEKAVGSKLAIQNLRNAAEVFAHVKGGVTIPAQTAIGRWMVDFGFDPKFFGLEQPQFAQEAKKAATMALYNTMQKSPALVGDLEARKYTIPDVDLEPDALRNLIANSISTLDFHSGYYNHMRDYIKNNNNNLYGYNPVDYRENYDAAKALAQAYKDLPEFKGQKTGATIGVKAGEPKPDTPLPTTMEIPGVPESAIKYLKEHPDLAPQFDQKYGQGMSAKVLGKGGQ